MGNCWNTVKVTRDPDMFYTSKSHFESTKCLQSPPPLTNMHMLDTMVQPSKLPTPRTECEILSSSYLKYITLTELKNATWNFRPENLIGEGGFGYVYKGWINEETLMATKAGCGTAVAVKKLKPERFEGHKEWLVSSLHCND